MGRVHVRVNLTWRLAATKRACGRSLLSVAVLVAAMMVGAVFSAGAQGAPGDLDLTFSGDGRQTTDFRFGFSRATAVARQADGKIVAVGESQAGFGLARYNPDGSLDPTFSGDGLQTTDFGGRATGVAIQADGRIVAVGGGGAGFAIARYNPSGSLDTSFSGDGRKTTDFGDFDGATGVAIQANGRIVAVGAVGVGFAGDFALARYNADGTDDLSFSGDGKQTTDFGGEDGASGVAIQSSGKIVAVGDAFDGSAFALARYNPNGTLDTSFSGDGRQTTNFGGGGAARGVALQADGKIVVVGGAGSGLGDPDFALARYNPNGSPDTTFSGDGRQTTNFGGIDGANGVAIQANGKIVTAGSAEGAGGFALARYNPNGTLDTSFSGDGRQTTNFLEANGVVLQPDGKIVAVGGTADDFALVRYNPNGSLDTSFSGDGRQTTDFEGDDAASGVAIQADGKVIAVGLASGFSTDFALARYNPNGSPDATFSGDGRQTTNFGDHGQANAVALQGDGKIVAVGAVGARGLRARPLQPQWLARHVLLRRRQADDQPRG